MSKQERPCPICGGEWQALAQGVIGCRVCGFSCSGRYWAKLPRKVPALDQALMLPAAILAINSTSLDKKEVVEETLIFFKELKRQLRASAREGD